MAFAGLASCNKDLDLTNNNDVTASTVYSSAAAYKSQLAKVYSCYALTSSSGASSSDLGGIDAGTSDFLRLFWGAQELTTDEAACAWVSDDGVGDLDYNTWSSTNVLLQGLYTRSLYQITVANDFISNASDDNLASKDITGDSATLVQTYRAEARFIRAYQYWVLMDLFGNPPFVDENSEIGSTAPTQILRADLYNYVVSELLSIESSLVTAGNNEYGRADQGACDALLARIYLNAAVYTGTAKYDSAVIYSEKVINDGYSLKSDYAELFMADNNLDNPEVILSINYDGLYTQTYGGTTYIINADVNGAMTPADFGIPSGGWGGNRSRATLFDAFEDTASDNRAMFWYSSTATSAITDMSTFTQGMAVTKFTNLTSDGETASSVGGVFCSTDFPIFRLAEMYLTYAEATLRGGSSGSSSTALTYVNLLRQRAYGSSSGDITTLTLSGILAERMKELYWEGFRRTDLIRYGLYTGSSYVWPWKGGVAAGQSIDSYRSLFPLPNADVVANTNLTQNTGY
ncbi:MAG: RagB/SusD family nutrient uptake outer membrane protein [Chitinophagaceae bacterium]